MAAPIIMGTTSVHFVESVIYVKFVDRKLPWLSAYCIDQDLFIASEPGKLINVAGTNIHKKAKGKPC